MRTACRSGVAWLELVLVLAIVSLLLQLFPSALSWAHGVVDVRNWSHGTWFMANLAVVGALLAVRLAPELREAIARRKDEAAKRKKREDRKRRAEEREARSMSRGRIRW